MVFGYNQFIVLDSAVSNAAFQWTDDNMNQGFARQDSVVSFVTLTQYGKADLRVFLSEYTHDAYYERVIAVPFYSVSGKLVVEGPEESGLMKPVEIPKGNYFLFAAQKKVGDDSLRCFLGIDLFLERQGNRNDCQIIKADSLLKPPKTLIQHTSINEDVE